MKSETDCRQTATTWRMKNPKLKLLAKQSLARLLLQNFQPTTRPTVCVTCWRASVDSTRTQKNIHAKEISKKAADSRQSGARFVGRGINEFAFLSPWRRIFYAQVDFTISGKDNLNAKQKAFTKNRQRWATTRIEIIFLTCQQTVTADRCLLANWICQNTEKP